MTRSLRLLAGAAFALATGAAALAVGLPGQQLAFPHRRHARLFPLCAGCHDMSGARDAFYPEPAVCARCHDGQQTARVTWAPPTPKPGNVRFSHARHERATSRENPPLDCAACHATGTGRMQVGAARAPTCLDCHAHRATSHFADASCSTCHVSLAEASFTAQALQELPQPPDHGRADFLSTHGAGSGENANCRFCHVRDQCADCHVNSAAVQEIQQLPPAPPVLAVRALEPEYPVPESHERPDFITAHGRLARTSSCAACHTRESCTTCHTGRLPDAVAALTPASATEAPGVTIRQAGLARTAMPLTHAAPAFRIDHGNLAATRPESCSTCHARQECEACHDAPARPAYHPPNFMASHSSAAYTGRLECSNCHERTTFCRECHAQTGQTSTGRLVSPVFHDAEPLWLLRHGGAARRGLESCTSCHAQRDCLQCHSTLGAFKVNPHGRDFDARRAQERNPIICRACHVGDPIGR